MRLKIRSSATYELSDETYLLVMVEPPPEGPDHRVIEGGLTTEPDGVIVGGWTAELGNPVRRVLAPAGTFRFEYNATIAVEANRPIPFDAVQHPPAEIPDAAMPYTWPSRYCQSDLLARLATSEFGELGADGRRAQAIADWIRDRVEYRYGTTDAKTSAFDTATERIGVCRDFAHLLIAFCRALDIPARYVSGYALDLEPSDFHGYAQVYLGSQWHNLDATYAGLRPALVPIAIGRDAADVAMTTLWGSGTLQEQRIEVSRDEEESGSYGNPSPS